MTKVDLDANAAGLPEEGLEGELDEEVAAGGEEGAEVLGDRLDLGQDRRELLHVPVLLLRRGYEHQLGPQLGEVGLRHGLLDLVVVPHDLVVQDDSHPLANVLGVNSIAQSKRSIENSSISDFNSVLFVPQP